MTDFILPAQAPFHIIYLVQDLSVNCTPSRQKRETILLLVLDTEYHNTRITVYHAPGTEYTCINHPTHLTIIARCIIKRSRQVHLMYVCMYNVCIYVTSRDNRRGRFYVFGKQTNTDRAAQSTSSHHLPPPPPPASPTSWLPSAST